MAGKAFRTEQQKLLKLARGIMPDAQAGRRDFIAIDAPALTDECVMTKMRDKELRTVQKLTRIEKLLRAGTIEKHEAQACQWYGDAHALGYDTLGVVANYGGSGGGRGNAGYTHLARYKAQSEARADYEFAKPAIPPTFLKMFEAIVIEGKAMHDADEGLYGQLARSQRADKIAAAFRLCANKLHGRIAHVLPIGGA